MNNNENPPIIIENQSSVKNTEKHKETKNGFLGISKKWWLLLIPLSIWVAIRTEITQGVPDTIRSAMRQDLKSRYPEIDSVKLVEKIPVPAIKDSASEFQVNFKVTFKDGTTRSGFAYYGRYSLNDDWHLGQVNWD